MSKILFSIMDRFISFPNSLFFPVRCFSYPTFMIIGEIMDAKEKAWSNFEKAKIRMWVGMLISFTLLIGTLIVIVIYGEDAIPIILQAWIPRIATLRIGISWLQVMLVGDEVESQYL